MNKTKQQLINEANDLAKEHHFKKEVIEKMLNDLDKNKTLTENHINSIPIIQSILEEMDVLEKKYNEIKEQIKK